MQLCSKPLNPCTRRARPKRPCLAANMQITRSRRSLCGKEGARVRRSSPAHSPAPRGSGQDCQTLPAKCLAKSLHAIRHRRTVLLPAPGPLHPAMLPERAPRSRLPFVNFASAFRRIAVEGAPELNRLLNTSVRGSFPLYRLGFSPRLPFCNLPLFSVHAYDVPSAEARGKPSGRPRVPVHGPTSPDPVRSGYWGGSVAALGHGATLPAVGGDLRPRGGSWGRRWEGPRPTRRSKIENLRLVFRLAP